MKKKELLKVYFAITIAVLVATSTLIGFYLQLSPIVSFLISVNTFALLFFGFDKLQAVRRGFRVPEMVLWGIALIGGSVGALLGMNLFRHKTRKTSFQFVLVMIILLQIGIGYFAFEYLGKTLTNL